MNQPRRTLSDAVPGLSAEAVALIKEGTPKPQTQTPTISPMVATVAPRPAPMPMAPAEASLGVKPRAQKERGEEPASAVAMVSMNFRVPASIPPALLKASSERKMRKTRPFTQQDIVTEALAAWLQKNGYQP